MTYRPNSTRSPQLFHQGIVFTLVFITPAFILGFTILLTNIGAKLLNQTVGMVGALPLVGIIFLGLAFVFIAPMIVGEWVANSLGVSPNRRRWTTAFGTVLGVAFLFGLLYFKGKEARFFNQSPSPQSNSDNWRIASATQTQDQSLGGFGYFLKSE